MKKAHAKFAAVFALGFASQVQAVPIYFDFTGTSLGSDFEGAQYGEPMAGGFVLETGNLLETTAPPRQRQWIDDQLTGASGSSAYVNVGSMTLPVGSWSSFVALSFADNCTPGACSEFGPDNFNVFFSSTDQPFTPDFTGTLRSTFFYFASAGVTPTYELFDYFDLAHVGPGSVATLPLHSLSGVYGEDLLDCVDGFCTTISARHLPFSIDTLTRSEGVRSVPEPGTLGLSGAGLMAAFCVRRRQKPALAPRQQRA